MGIVVIVSAGGSKWSLETDPGVGTVEVRFECCVREMWEKILIKYDVS